MWRCIEKKMRPTYSKIGRRKFRKITGIAYVPLTATSIFCEAVQCVLFFVFYYISLRVCRDIGCRWIYWDLVMLRRQLRVDDAGRCRWQSKKMAGALGSPLIISNGIVYYFVIDLFPTKCFLLGVGMATSRSGHQLPAAPLLLYSFPF